MHYFRAVRSVKHFSYTFFDTLILVEHDPALVYSGTKTPIPEALKELVARILPLAYLNRTVSKH